MILSDILRKWKIGIDNISILWYGDVEIENFKEEESMGKYEDRIGEFAVGTKDDGREFSGYLIGVYDGIYYVSSIKDRIGTNEGILCTSIRFIADEQKSVHPMFEHSGKTALVWDDDKRKAQERTLIGTKRNGRCVAVEGGDTLDDYYNDIVGSMLWNHYELIPEKTLDLKCTYQGKEISHEEALELLSKVK